MRFVQLGLLGGGRMGEALVGGLIAAEWSAAQIAIAEVDPDRRHVLEARFPEARVVPSAAWAVADAEVVVVAVKPNDVVASLLSCVETLPPDALVVSIAAGVPIATIEAAVPGRPVVRAMPNTPALVGRAASAIAPGSHAERNHVDLAASILGGVGTVVEVPEKSIDAVTGLSGSGPAYVFLLAEALIDAGVLVGLPRTTARDLAIQTLLGSAELLAGSSDGPEAQRAAVTSPGGTTAAALQVLEQRGFRAALIDAVVAATERSREIGAGS
jgi:pyrroline-5-carboxylate reductase